MEGSGVRLIPGGPVVPFAPGTPDGPLVPTSPFGPGRPRDPCLPTDKTLFNFNTYFTNLFLQPPLKCVMYAHDTYHLSQVTHPCLSHPEDLAQKPTKKI